MEWMDGARRVGGLAWVVAGVLFGIGAAAVGVVPGLVTLVLVVAVVVLAALVVLDRVRGLPGGVLRIGGRLVALLYAAVFAGAVADRFGAFGPPGAPGVSWGNWAAFVEETGVLLHGVPGPVAVVAAVAATVAEVALAVGLLLGRQRRWVGKAAAGLLVVYLVAMASSVGWGDVARYALPIEIGGALLLTVGPVRRAEAGRPVDPVPAGR